MDKAIELHEPFKDGRSAAKRYKTAQQCTKPERVKSRVNRALNAVLSADCFLADAWFGSKAVTQELDVQLLYKRCVRKAWRPLHGQKYQANAIDVELNLAEAKDPEQWIKVRLLFVRGVACDTR